MSSYLDERPKRLIDSKVVFEYFCHIRFNLNKVSTSAIALGILASDPVLHGREIILRTKVIIFFVIHFHNLAVRVVLQDVHQ